MSADSGSTAAVRSRRAFLGAALGTPLALASTAAQQPATIPPSPPRDWNGGDPLRYPDPDIVVLDQRFRRYMIGNTPIRRLHTGTLWAEGPAWNGVGRYLVWSDIPNNVQLRWLEDDGRVSVFRNPSGNSNGNTFDYAGPPDVLRARRAPRRPLRAQRRDHRHRRQVPGQAAQLAQRRRRAPRRQHLVHRSDLRHPRQLRRLQGRVGNQAGRLPGRSASPAQIAHGHRRAHRPNGLCFSPDYKRLYVADTGTRPRHPRLDVDGTTRAQRAAPCAAGDAGLAGRPSAADGMRCDVDGNIWAGARPGVQVIAPDGAPSG